MSLLASGSEFFGMDIGTTGIRAVHLRGGNPKSLVKYAYMPLDMKVAMSDSKVDQEKLAASIEQLVKQAGISTKHVAVGIPSSRVFTTVADVERLPEGELAKAIPYQADSLIPTPMAESKIDWAVIGDSPSDKTKQEILLTSVANDFVESRLDILESIGLNVIAFEPDNLAVARALTDNSDVPQMIVNVGHRATDLVITLNSKPHLTRNIPTGLEALIRTASQNMGVDEKQAQQFILKFGLGRDKLEGQVFQALSAAVDLLMTEIEKSIKFFNTRYNGSKVSQIIVTGAAAVIPEFPVYLANKFGIDVQIGNTWRNVSYSQDRQNELAAISNQFAVAVGLAERT